MVESWTDTLRRHWRAADLNSYARSSHKATICSLNPDLIVKKNMDLRRSGMNVKSRKTRDYCKS